MGRVRRAPGRRLRLLCRCFGLNVVVGVVIHLTPCHDPLVYPVERVHAQVERDEIERAHEDTDRRERLGAQSHLGELQRPQATARLQAGAPRTTRRLVGVQPATPLTTTRAGTGAVLGGRRCGGR